MTLLELLNKWKKKFGLAKLGLIAGYTRNPLHVMIVTKTITDKQRRVIMENIAEYLSELVRDFEKVND